MTDDMAKVQRLLELDQRYLPLMFNIMPGKATEELAEELKTLFEGYKDLFNQGAPQFAFYTLESVRGKMADVEESIARTYDSLNSAVQAGSYYERAARTWDEIGAAEKAKRCRDALARLRLSVEGNFDDELQRLQSALESAPANSLQHAKTGVELGELYSKTGDDFEAEKLLLKAKAELDGIGGNPEGTDLAQALTKSLTDILNGQHQGGETYIEQQMLARSLYRRVYVGLSAIYREKDLDLAAKYMSLAKGLDSGEMNQEFSQQMLQSLAGNLGKLLNNE